jgi:diamine N-acetyltransferase
MADRTENVELVPIDAANWRAVAAIAPHPDQELFVAPTTYYLCLAHYNGEWNPLAIVRDGSVVGHLMWAVDEEESGSRAGGCPVLHRQILLRHHNELRSVVCA